MTATGFQRRRRELAKQAKEEASKTAPKKAAIKKKVETKKSGE